MKGLTIISLLAGIIFTNKSERKLYNPSIFFPLLWTIIYWLGQLRLFALYETSEIATMCIQLGTLSFTIGSLLWGRFRQNYSLRTTERNIISGRYFNYILLYLVAMMCIIYYLPGLLRTIPTLLGGISNLSAIRLSVQSAEANTGIANFFYNFIILPFSIVIEVLGVVDFWFGKRDKKLFSLSITLITVRVLSDAGRTPLFNFIIYMLLGYALSKKKRFKKLSDRIEETKKSKQIKRYAVIAAFFLGIVTISRTASSFLRILYFYFAMPNVMLSRWIETVDQSNFVSYGVTSFNGIYYGISYIVKNVIGIPHPKIIINSFNEIILTDSTWLKINAQTTTANAYVSTFWFFYTDFRMFGVILLSFFYGIYLCNLYMNVQKVRSEKNLCLYLLGFQGMFFSFIRFPYAKTYYWIAFFLLRYLIYRSKNRVGLSVKQSINGTNKFDLKV